MIKRNSQFPEILFQKKSLTTIMLIFALCGCESKKIDNSFILDNIQYEINDGGVGYDVKNNDSLDLNKASFVAMLHITNLSKSNVNLDTSKFKLIGEYGKSFSLATKMNGMDVSVMYNQKIEPGETIDYMLTFAVPKAGHYNLHVISTLSSIEEVIHY